MEKSQVGRCALFAACSLSLSLSTAQLSLSLCLRLLAGPLYRPHAQRRVMTLAMWCGCFHSMHTPLVRHNNICLLYTSPSPRDRG
eukprot:4467499-Amphidinium_carterae.1